MKNPGLTNCPNCDQRIFENSNKCPYCKYNLKEEKHNFDEEIYNFLYQKYSENKNKPQIIKLGMEKYNMSMKDIKEIVDYIAEQIYQKEITENKESVEKSINEELPTNGIDYSKPKYNKKYQKKLKIISTILLILYFIILILIIKKIETISLVYTGIVIFIIFLFSVIKLYIKETPDEHTFTVSMIQYLIHGFIPKLVIASVIIGLLFLSCKFIPSNILDKVIPLYIFGGIIILLSFFKDITRQLTHKITVNYGQIEYTILSRHQYGHGKSGVHNAEKRYTDDCYEINSITEVKETLNHIIIYGDIEKTRVEKENGQIAYPIIIESSKSKKKKLKFIKSFKNNKNLIKALKMCAKK